MPGAPADHRTIELPASPPPPPRPRRETYPDDGRRRDSRTRAVWIGLLAVALVAALVAAGWQAVAAQRTAGELADLEARVEALEADRARLEAENERLRDELAAVPPERPAPDDPDADDQPSDPGAATPWERELDGLRERLEQELDDLADDLARGLRELFGSG